MRVWICGSTAHDGSLSRDQVRLGLGHLRESELNAQAGASSRMVVVKLRMVFVRGFATVFRRLGKRVLEQIVHSLATASTSPPRCDRTGGRGFDPENRLDLLDLKNGAYENKKTSEKDRLPLCGVTSIEVRCKPEH